MILSTNARANSDYIVYHCLKNTQGAFIRRPVALWKNIYFIHRRAGYRRGHRARNTAVPSRTAALPGADPYCKTRNLCTPRLRLSLSPGAHCLRKRHIFLLVHPALTERPQNVFHTASTHIRISALFITPWVLLAYLPCQSISKSIVFPTGQAKHLPGKLLSRT
jgi:hypothetical protein